MNNVTVEDDDGLFGFRGTSLSGTAAGLDPSGLQNKGTTRPIALEPASVGFTIMAVIEVEHLEHLGRDSNDFVGRGCS